MFGEMIHLIHFICFFISLTRENSHLLNKVSTKRVVQMDKQSGAEKNKLPCKIIPGLKYEFSFLFLIILLLNAFFL